MSNNLLSNLLFSINAVGPVVLIAAFGYVLKRARFITDGFWDNVDKLTFRVAFPVLLFRSVAEADLSSAFNPFLIVFCAIGLVLTVILCAVPALLIIKDPAVRGAFVHGAYRSNTVIFGVAIIIGVFGDGEAAGTTALTLAFIIPLVNILAVVILSLNGAGGKITLPGILKNIALNPLILGTAAGAAGVFLKEYITFPQILDSATNSIAAIATPLALMSLGAGFDMSSAIKNLKLSLPAVALKLIIFPLAACAIAVPFGFRGLDLLFVYIVFGSPTAAAAYIMGKNMNSDYELTGQIIMLSTVFSAFTIIAGLFTMKTFGLL